MAETVTYLRIVFKLLLLFGISFGLFLVVVLGQLISCSCYFYINLISSWEV